MKLGKLEPREDARTLQLASYLTPTLPAAPSSLHLESKVPSWPLYGNDIYGDCVFADVGHQIETWTANSGTEVSVTQADVLGAYSAVTGFNPNDPSTDQGTVWLDALNYWRRTGIAGHTIAGYASVARNAQVKVAAWLFGGVQLGMALPLTARSQVGQIWYDVGLRGGPASQPGSWGGHAVPVVAYTPTQITVVTWGRLQSMTYGFFRKYCDEAYAALSHDWISAVSRRSPEGFDLLTLQADLAKFGK